MNVLVAWSNDVGSIPDRTFCILNFFLYSFNSANITRIESKTELEGVSAISFEVKR